MRLVAMALALAACAHTTTPDTYVRMERIGCLGACPVYTLTLYADGAVQFRGSWHVPKHTRWGTASRDDVGRLMGGAERVPRWRCDRPRVTDQPAAVITVSRRGQLTQRIVPDDGDPCTPESARELEMGIDAAGHASQFIDK
ncbi:MAG TPA: DUF6438 domain-containing protein [Kofleriaceae bacterium]|jgi:hypothetical protein|nr:DUF6438 domain-containing protein [Kofleriaceae bacterium]